MPALLFHPLYFAIRVVVAERTPYQHGGMTDATS